jgi:hypothetical protein
MHLDRWMPLFLAAAAVIGAIYLLVPVRRADTGRK